MTDQELLALAAKAEGRGYIKDCVWIENGFYSPINRHERIAWNPLHDDGDAFRLAVKLQMNIEVFSYGVATISGYGRFILERAITDHFVAARRAIVRAAAEIGSRMP